MENVENAVISAENKANEVIDAKTEMMPIGKNVLVLPYQVNPYAQAVTAEGFQTTDGGFFNEDSGEKDQMEQTFICAKIVEVGPDTQVIKEGDDVIYHKGSSRPLPFMGLGLFIVSESSVLTVIGQNLKERF